MLKNIRNNFQNIKYTEPGTSFDWAAWCRNTNVPAYNSAYDKWKEADDQYGFYQDAIDELTENNKQLGEINGDYSRFRDDLNDCWKGPDGHAGIKDYDKLEADITCLTDFCTALDETLQTLNTEQKAWDTKRTEAKGDMDANYNANCASSYKG